MPAEHETPQYEPGRGGPGGDDVAQRVEGTCTVLSSDPPGVTKCRCYRDPPSTLVSFSAECPGGGWGAAIESGSTPAGTFYIVTDPNSGAQFKLTLRCS